MIILVSALTVGLMVKLKTTDLSKKMKAMVSSMVGICPCCKNDMKQDERYKRTATGNPLKIRRVSSLGVQKECGVCSFRFYFTWKSFRNSLQKRADFDDPVWRSCVEEVTDLVDETEEVYKERKA